MIREPAVAGMFYPASKVALRESVSDLISGAGVGVLPDTAVRAVIVPHAGYVYSGPVAANAYARVAATLSRDARHIRRVVLLGPAHRVALKMMALSSADAFATPLGQIPVDQAACLQLSQLPGVEFNDVAHREEHSLEVQLPFLQTILREFSLVPVVVGEVAPEDVARVLEPWWQDPETLIVISSDLSHYHDYGTARDRDARTSRAIETKNYRAIGYGDACGRNPLGGLLYLASRDNSTVDTIDLRNSGDTAGPRDQVVGYGAYLVH